MSAAAGSEEHARALLDARTALLARRSTRDVQVQATRPYLVCAVGGEHCGLPLDQVAAVLPMRPCTVLPGATAALRGIVAVSGSIVTVIDLALALGLSAASDAAPAGGHLARLRSQEPPVALAVERVLGIARIGASVEAAPDMVRAAGLGGDAVSGYAPPGSDLAGGIGEGFSLIDLPRLLRRYLS